MGGKMKMKYFPDAMIDQDRVDTIFLNCLSDKGEKYNGKQVHFESSTLVSICFNPQCLRDYRDEIEEILNDLHPDFMPHNVVSGNIEKACLDGYGNRWTNLEASAEALLLLGMAIGKVERVKENGELRYYMKN